MKLNANVTLKQLAAELKKLEKCYVIRHKSPDGDAIAAQFGMVLGLRSLGIDAQPLHTDPVPEAYHYLTDAIETEDIGEAPFIAVDSATHSRLQRYEKAPILFCIDHHEKNSIDARFRYVEEDASSCAQVVLRVLEALGVEPTPELATLLYIGLLTDTNGFRSVSTNADSMLAAAKLAACGIEPGLIARRHCFYKSEKRLAAEGSMMRTLRYSHGGHVLSCMLTWEEFDRIGIDDAQLEGINSLVEQVEGAQIAIVLRERAPKVCRFSIRAAKGFSAADICARFGGGGHANAAGCELTGDPLEQLARIEAACAEYLAEKGV